MRQDPLLKSKKAVSVSACTYRRGPALVLGWFVAGLLLLQAAGPQPALGQETRAEERREQRREKAEELHPPDTSFVERAAAFIEEKMSGGEPPGVGGLGGVELALGGLRSGAGTTAGLRYVPPLPYEDLYVSLEALGSIREYFGVGGVLGYEDGGPVAYAFGRFRHMPEEDFYGIGPQAQEAWRSSYRHNETVVGGLLGVNPFPSVLVGGHAAYQINRLGTGRDDELPTIRDVFSEAEVPGLLSDIDYLLLGGWAEVDTRALSPLRAYGRRFAPTQRRLRGLSLDVNYGIQAAAVLVHHLHVGSSHYDFTRLELESQQYLPFRNGYHVFALREFLSVTRTAEGEQVPFYLMQTLGGSRSIRGFQSFRFRDRNALLVNAEYRWKVWILLDLALFVDAGQVFHRLEDLAWGDTQVGYGVGFRFKTSPDRIIARFDLAWSGEGFTYYMKFGSIF